MIEEVKRLSSELTREALRKFYVLEQRKVSFPESRRADSTWTLSWFGGLAGRSWLEGRCIKPIGERVGGARIGIANLIHAAADRCSAEAS